ncbi:MAG: hypothetical protein IT444_11200 [Phycisphaeraceae bacterium]|nr:hypothetical protein [Phycisphaeraceae bacterium]
MKTSITDLAERFAKLPAAPIESGLELRAGTRRDYRVLAKHHYRAGEPATITRVLVLAEPARAGSRWRRGGDSTPAAVLLESLPSLACRLRDQATCDRYAAIRDPVTRASLLNAEIRCISRVVVDPRWRGLGLAVRLVRAALRTATTPYTEALAAMGRVNPFFERAGMTAYRRPPHAHDARLVAALDRVGIAVVSLGLLDLTVTRIDKLPLSDRAWLVRELTRWYARSQKQRGSRPPVRDMLAAARRRLLCEPVYYLHRSSLASS